MFYTYIYRRKDGTPYYTGKGTGDRAYQTRHRVRPPEPARILIQYWGSETEAFQMEKWYIKLFGRKDNGTGILRNMTDGGVGGDTRSGTKADGTQGPWPHQTELHRQRISMALKARGIKPPSSRGKIRSAETRLRISEAAKRRDPSTRRGRYSKKES